MFDFLKKKKPEFAELNLTCPRCLITMKKINKAGILIDTCTRCGGIWLDDKEIDKLLDFIKSQSQKTGNDLKKEKTSPAKVK